MPRLIAGVGGGSLLLFAALGATTLRRALSASNWLLACDGHRVLIKIRSHLNVHLPAEIPHVLELPLSEVEAVRATPVTVQGLDSARMMIVERMLFLDLRIQAEVDLSELRERLHQERSLRGRGAVWRHYPVSLTEERTIRIEWRSKRARIVPRIDRVVALLGPREDVARGVGESIELGGAGRKLDERQALAQVRSLAEQGRVIEAVILARRAFGWSTTKARDQVEQIKRPSA